jgi:hypothetical protein
MLKSRKYVSTLAVAVLAVLNDALKLGIQQETILLVAGVVASFILGESAIDAASALGSKGEAKPTTSGTSTPTSSPGP